MRRTAITSTRGLALLGAALLLLALVGAARSYAVNDVRGAHTGSFGSGPEARSAGGPEAFVARGGRSFPRAKLRVSGQRAYDLGTVDFNSDGLLDVFTMNHMFRDTLLRGVGGGRFEDAYDDMRFSQVSRIPGMTSITKQPRLTKPGVYFYMKANRKRPNIHIKTTGLGKIGGIDGKVSGTITVVFPKVRVNRSRNANVRVRTVSKKKTKIVFNARDNADIAIRANHIALPFETKFDRPMPPDNIWLGAYPVRAKNRKLPTIELGDRHGAGWADFDSNGRLDAALVGGGIAGKIDDLPGLLQDELMINKGSRFKNESRGSGLRKGPCRGRESLPADANKDGSLDLLVGCRDGRPRLYESTGGGKFRNVSKRLKRLGSGGTALRWADVDNDRRMELIQGGKQFVKVWELGRSGRARMRQRIATRNDSQNVDSIAPGDFDNDGDADLFIASRSGNTLLVNRRGRLRAHNPSRFRLPGSSAAASWVDYNNDSKLDLHTNPQGVFKRRGKRRFKKTRLVRSNKRQRFGRASWFDADNDGRRDVALVVQVGTGPSPKVRFFRNNSSRQRRWLELDLVGPPGNRQAIGARVSLRTGKRRKLTQWVGQNDGARYGSGHYRLYFGLGRKRVARGVTVRWPGGGKTKLGKVKSNRVKTVRR